MKTTFPIIGMHCASCASVIKRKLEKLAGVESCAVNYGTEQAHISFDPDKVTVAQMNSQIDQLGYGLLESQGDTSNSLGMDHNMHTESAAVPVSTDNALKARKLAELTNLKHQVQIMLPMVAVSIIVMIWEIGADSLHLWPTIPEVIMEFFHHLLPIFATYALFVVGIPYLTGMLRFFRYRVANMDTLVGIGTTVAFLYSFIVTAFEVPLAPFMNTSQNYYDVTIVVVGFITLGKFLEARSKLKTGQAIEKLMGLQAKNALVIRDGKEMEIPVDQVIVGDIILVKPGAKIPLDGVIREGKSCIDESMITGESIPVDKKPGDAVIGATINKQGSLQITVTKIGSDTMLSQIIKMVEAAQGSKAPIERLADRVSAVFVPVVLVLSVVTFALWLLIGSQFMPPAEAFTLGLLSFVGILVIACPCAMGLATPTAIIVGVGQAAQHGILIKNAESLERLHDVNIVVMDKTGTLTKGTPQVTDITTVTPHSEKQILQLLASLERFSEHPLALAVTGEAKKRKLSLLAVKNFAAIEGKGLRGTIDGTQYYAGNLALVHDLKQAVDENVIHAFTSQGKTPVIMMTAKKIIGYISIADTIKDNAKETVATLTHMGIAVWMITGDHEATAQYIARQVGITNVLAGVLPAQKAKKIHELKNAESKQNVVAFVGDGINDAPALAAADIGIAMGSGTDIAIESAGITLLNQDLRTIVSAIKLSKATFAVIKQNLFWAFGYNVILIPVAAGIFYPITGWLLNPALAAFAMAASSISVVTNSLRLKRVHF